jgi:MFS family permease
VQAELNAPQDVITCTRKSINDNGIGTGLPQCIPMNTTQLGLVSSIFTLGGLIGALGAGPVAARYGRLTTMRLTTIFCTLGPVGEALAPNIGALATGRFVSGLGAGAALVVVPIYLSEISPPRQKGFFGAFTQIMTNMGIFITQLLGYFLSHGQMWRIILAAAGIIGLIQLAGLTLAIDSPKWQADQGRAVQAKRGLQRIRGYGVDIQREVEGWGVKSARGSEGMRSP